MAKPMDHATPAANPGSVESKGRPMRADFNPDNPAFPRRINDQPSRPGGFLEDLIPGNPLQDAFNEYATQLGADRTKARQEAAQTAADTTNDKLAAFEAAINAAFAAQED